MYTCRQVRNDNSWAGNCELVCGRRSGGGAGLARSRWQHLPGAGPRGAASIHTGGRHSRKAARAAGKNGRQRARRQRQHSRGDAGGHGGRRGGRTGGAAWQGTPAGRSGSPPRPRTPTDEGHPGPAPLTLRWGSLPRPWRWRGGRELAAEGQRRPAAQRRTARRRRHRPSRARSSLPPARPSPASSRRRPPTPQSGAAANGRCQPPPARPRAAVARWLRGGGGVVVREGTGRRLPLAAAWHTASQSGERTRMRSRGGRKGSVAAGRWAVKQERQQNPNKRLSSPQKRGHSAAWSAGRRWAVSAGVSRGEFVFVFTFKKQIRSSGCNLNITRP